MSRPTPGGLPGMLSRPDAFSGLRGTGKGGTWRAKPPDAESAACPAFLAGLGLNPESVGECQHLSGERGVGRIYLIIQPTLTYPNGT